MKEATTKLKNLGGKKLGLIATLSLGVILMYFLGAQFSSKSVKSQYESRRPLLEDEYLKMRTKQEEEIAKLMAQQAYEICVAEKELSKVKLLDVLNGIKSSDDFNVITMKANRNCEVMPAKANEEVKSNGIIPTASAEIIFDGEHVATIDHEKYGAELEELVFTTTTPQLTKSEDRLDDLARAVAVAETSNCTKGYGVTHNNCHGIKKGNTYPCTTKGTSRMCNFATKEESFTAFKIIWSKWYKNNPPTKENAVKWTGNDKADSWLKNVKNQLNKK